MLTESEKKLQPRKVIRCRSKYGEKRGAFHLSGIDSRYADSAAHQKLSIGIGARL